MDIKELRKRYKEITGKKAYHGFTEEQLLQKIAKADGAEGMSGAEVVIGASVEAPNQENTITFNNADTVYPVTFIGEPLPETTVVVQPFKVEAGPDMSRTYKTGIEVVRDLQAGTFKPVILEFNEDAKWDICDYLYKVLNDGSYRASILKFKPREDSKRDFMADLQELKSQVKEGEKKSEVEYFINLLNNLK